jgi:hypothetical protein
MTITAIAILEMNRTCGRPHVLQMFACGLILPLQPLQTFEAIFN